MVARSPFCAPPPFRRGFCGVVTLAAHVVLDELTFAGVTALEGSWRKGGLRAELERFHGPGADPLFRGWPGLWLDPARRDWSIIDRLSRHHLPGARDPGRRRR